MAGTAADAIGGVAGTAAVGGLQDALEVCANGKREYLPQDACFRSPLLCQSHGCSGCSIVFSSCFTLCAQGDKQHEEQASEETVKSEK